MYLLTLRNLVRRYTTLLAHYIPGNTDITSGATDITGGTDITTAAIGITTGATEGTESIARPSAPVPQTKRFPNDL